MTSNLETIQVSKVRGAASAPQISAMPSSMAADPTKQEVLGFGIQQSKSFWLALYGENMCFSICRFITILARAKSRISD